MEENERLRVERMSGTRRRKVRPGDIVRTGMSIQHAPMHFVSALAVFVHEKQEGQLHLEGRPELAEDQSAAVGTGALRSVAELTCTIPAAAEPGVYALTRVLIETYGGRVFSYGPKKLAEWTSISFEVVDEPGDTPVIESIGYMKW